MKQSKKNHIGLGTAAIGRPHYINIRQEASSAFSLETFKQKGHLMLEEAYQQGVRYFDTAPGYGMAEQLLIDWVKGKEDTSIEIATKWGYTYVANFDPNATQHEIKEHSLAKLQEQWEQSKTLLPLLTTYQIHSATFDTGVLENQAVLNHLFELKEEHGLVMGITTSGDNQIEVIKKALDIEVGGNALFNAFQVTYNIFDQSLAKISAQLSADNRRIIIKEALANGRIFPNKNFPHHTDVYNKLQELATKYKVGIDAIALRFCIDSIDAYTVLSGATNKGHLSDNLKTMQFELDKNEVAFLKELAVAPKSYWAERKKLAWN